MHALSITPCSLLCFFTRITSSRENDIGRDCNARNWYANQNRNRMNGSVFPLRPGFTLLENSRRVTSSLRNYQDVPTGHARHVFTVPGCLSNSNTSFGSAPFSFRRASPFIASPSSRNATSGDASIAEVGDGVPLEADVVVIGAGIGGLCCASLLAKYGLSVVVCESHSVAGGAGHAFKKAGYTFDSGPSFHAGLSMKRSLNPLKQVLDILGEKVPCVTYDTWIGYLPEGKITFKADAEGYRAEIGRVGGAVALREWRELEQQIKPFAAAAAALPAAALRNDVGVVATLSRFLPGLVRTLPWAPQLLKPFSSIVDKTVSSPFLRHLIDLECFVLSGMLADSTLTAEMAFMFFERSRPEGTIDYPIGGGGALIDALVRGFQKNGGHLLVRTHVDEIVVANGKAHGVRVRRRPPKGSAKTESDTYVISAKKAVVSNASIWDTAELLKEMAGNGLGKGDADKGNSATIARRADETGRTGSFLHLHLGIDATGLPPDLECHHLIVNDWDLGIEAPLNVIIISIPSVFDQSLAPPGRHTVHCYSAGNEPYELWEGLDRQSKEYRALKEERSQALWRALEHVIPDIRQRAELTLVGTPLTHERYLRRNRGTYGAAVKAGEKSWPGPRTEIPGLLCCGDSTMPGIGVPAVAASGLMAANTLLPVRDHMDMLDKIEEAART
eukprot:TRINITY_DN10250_c0_g1_i1.p1 TRINITY_DN10250_c0_g1~~TRINITY_DN10250_c0_g1_i1.p1  ORF type:complete len:673 (-),score=66.47 TRINITY_DN10250_c0_g1_i1:273-2291(-)